MHSDLFEHKGRYIWRFRVSALYKGETSEIDWRTLLPAGVGSKHQREYLIASVRAFLEERIEHPKRKSRSGLAHSTVMQWYMGLKTLVRWMVQRNIWRFSKLTSEDVIDFLSERKARHGDGPPAETTIRKFCELFNELWLRREYYPASLRFSIEPLIDEITRECRSREPRPWKALDESAALELIDDALNWITKYGDYLCELADHIYVIQRSWVGKSQREHDRLKTALYAECCEQPLFKEIARHIGAKRSDALAISLAVSTTIGAAMILLLLVVGFRVSELVSLQVGCIVNRENRFGQRLPFLQGIAAKKGGVQREWVAAEPIPTIIRFLERFFSRMRHGTGSDELLVRRTQGAPIPLPGRRIRRIGTTTPVYLIRKFANAPFRHSKKALGNLHPHAARKTFARFAVKRDKRVLGAVSEHFGHTYAEFTDGAYVGADMQIEQLLDEAEREELGRALNVLLKAPKLAGRGVSVISEFRKNGESFQGKLALSKYIEELIQKGVKIAPCNWGYCIYTSSLSACKGDHLGPNEVNRSPEVCSGCSNFVVSEEHRSWWNARVLADGEFLKRTDLPVQTREVVLRRYQQSSEILKSLVVGKRKA